MAPPLRPSRGGLAARCSRFDAAAVASRRAVLMALENKQKEKEEEKKKEKQKEEEIKDEEKKIKDEVVTGSDETSDSIIFAAPRRSGRIRVPAAASKIPLGFKLRVAAAPPDAAIARDVPAPRRSERIPLGFKMRVAAAPPVAAIARDVPAPRRSERVPGRQRRARRATPLSSVSSSSQRAAAYMHHAAECLDEPTVLSASNTAEPMKTETVKSPDPVLPPPISPALAAAADHVPAGEFPRRAGDPDCIRCAKAGESCERVLGAACERCHATRKACIPIPRLLRRAARQLAQHKRQAARISGSSRAVYDREMARFVSACGVWERDRARWEGTNARPGLAGHEAHEAIMVVLGDIAHSLRMLSGRPPRNENELVMDF